MYTKTSKYIHTYMYNIYICMCIYESIHKEKMYVRIYLYITTSTTTTTIQLYEYYYYGHI